MKQWELGLIINPIAGMGGKVGLKGSDGSEILEKAKQLGAKPQSLDRTRIFLKELERYNTKLRFITITGIMGGNVLNSFQFETESLDLPSLNHDTKLFQTTPQHTREGARLLLNRKIDLILFVGGDGTARDIYESVGLKIPCLGIPGGVKIHSSVFATTPNAAAEIVKKFIQGETALRESEVMDINEEAFRENRVESKLYGYLNTPYLPRYVQPSKMASPHTEEERSNQERIAQYIINQMEQEDEQWYYLLGPGTTTRAIANLMNQPKSLLGVDFYHQQQKIAMDLNEQEILDQIDGKKVKLIVTPIGAQGFIFGRGNLQLSAKVLYKIGLKNIIIIATKFKMSTLPDKKMRIDSRNQEFDKKFAGLHRVIVDFGELVICKVESII